MTVFTSSLLGLLIVQAVPGENPTIRVGTIEQLRDALATARPGAILSVEPGVYRGGLHVEDLRGEPGRPIVVRAADPAHPPVFQGRQGIHFSRVQHLELHDLIIEGSANNGLNIDDGGGGGEASHHLRLIGLTVRDVGPEGNRDGIKLSGVDDFRLEDCTVERWGGSGSGVDLVGCHRGEIIGCAFRHEPGRGGNGVQAKGGSLDVAIRHCRFEHAGQRAVNLGGSTGAAYFRPRSPGYEARDLTVEDCVFVGSLSPIAFVGVDGAVVRHNTIYRPGRWCLRILQENRQPGFVACRNGSFTDNLIAFRRGEMVAAVNIGDATDPNSFTLARNAWYCLDDPARSRPNLPLNEAEGRYGIDPGFVDADSGDLRRNLDSPVRNVGARDRKS